ncbi:hypothetical protein EMCRGX_G029485 [Ephydatia muelleri]
MKTWRTSAVTAHKHLRSSVVIPRASYTNVSQGSTSRTVYGGRHMVTLIPGDGIGPELAASVKEVFSYANVPVDFEEILVSGLVSKGNKKTLERAVNSLQRNGVGIKGVIRTQLDDVDSLSLNMLLRTELDLFANVVRCRSIPGVKTRHDDVDIVIIRENTEGEYSRLEHEIVPGVVESLKIVTRARSNMIAKFAFDYATTHHRKRVTAIHKANIMKMSDGLFLRQCEQVASLYPDIEFKSMIIDNCCMQLISNPRQFDVMVMPNLYGNILSNIGAGLVGGPGLCPGKNVGIGCIVFEQGARHAAISKAFQNKANPTAMLLTSVDLLRHLGLTHHAQSIEAAVYKTISLSKIRTEDLGGTASTSQFVQAVIRHLESVGA